MTYYGYKSMKESQVLKTHPDVTKLCPMHVTVDDISFCDGARMHIHTY